MATVTLYANKDARIAQSGGTGLGAGASKRMPFGLYSGYKYRTLLGFSGTLPTGFITSARLYIRVSDEYYVAFGSTPRCYVERVTESWSEGTSDGLSGSNAVTWDNQPNVTTTNRATFTPGDTQNAWYSGLCTLLIRDAQAAGTFHGLRLGNYNEANGTNVGEIWSREQGTSYRAYLVIEYEDNAAPNAPTLTAPGNGSKVTDSTPDLSFTGSDPDAGDTLASYDIQVATDSGFASLVWDTSHQTTGISGFDVTRAYAGTALVRGTTYYWRARTTDADGLTGPWSSYRTFKYNSLPTCATKYSANWAAGPTNLNSTTENIASALKVALGFTPTDADGDSITGYELEVTGVATYPVSGSFASGVAISYTPAATFVNGTAYTYRVRAKDSEGVYGAWSALSQFRPRMSQNIYEFNVGAGNAPTVKTGTKTASLQLLYRIAAAGGTSPGSWSTSVPIPTASKPYLNVMVRMAVISGISGDVDQPTLSSLTVTWTTTDTTPYNWGFVGSNDDASTPWTLDRSGNANRYGINSVRGSISSASGNKYIYQDVGGLQPNTEYSFGAWVRPDVLQGAGVPVLAVRIFPYGLATGQIAVSEVLNSTSPFVGDGQWHRLVGRFTTGEYSGVRLMLHAQLNGAAVAELYWDAVMLSEGPVLPSWTPAMSGTPVILDAQGIYVDNEAGGIFRQTNAGISGERGLIELGGGGIRLENNEIDVVGLGTTAFATDVEPDRTGQYQFLINKTGQLNWGPGAGASRDTNLYRGAANVLATDDSLDVGGGVLVGQRLSLGNLIGPTLSANVNDWNPSGFSTASILRISSTGSFSISGMLAGAEGDLVLLYNNNATNTITLLNNSTASAVGNRMLIGGGNFVIPARGTVMLVYSFTQGAWLFVMG